MITQDELKAVVSYDEMTGLFRWLHAKSGRGMKKPRLAGHIAGSVNKHSGYVVIYIGSKAYFAHRLAWLYVFGKWPDNYIDHINEKRSDNRINNLRDVPSGTNLLNRSKEGIGVRRRKDRNTWVAYIGVADRDLTIGTFPTREEAVAARYGAKRMLELLRKDEV